VITAAIGAWAYGVSLTKIPVNLASRYVGGVMQKLLILASALFWSILMAGSVAAQTAVTTYHYDNLRMGWNQTETALTTANVNQQNFVPLPGSPFLLPDPNDQVDAQPLFVPSQYIAPNYKTLPAARMTLFSL
jgi:hypothetical protein